MGTDTSLLSGAKSGDCDAFNKLVETLVPKFKLSIQNKYHLQPQDVDDIVQNAMITAWTNIKSFRGESAFSTWFYAILRNEALDFLKKEGKRHHHETSVNNPVFDEQIEDYSCLFHDMLDQAVTDSAVTLLERQEQIKAYRILLEDVLTKLSKPHQDVLKMVLEDNMSYREVSERLGIPIGTVMSRLFLAKKQAQKLIEQYARRNEIELPHMG